MVDLVTHAIDQALVDTKRKKLRAEATHWLLHDGLTLVNLSLSGSRYVTRADMQHRIDTFEPTRMAPRE